MALTNKMWYAAATVGCAAIALTYLPPDREPPDWYRWRSTTRTPERNAARAARTALRESERALTLSKHRDQVLARLARESSASSAPGTPLSIDPALPLPWRETISAVIGDQLAFAGASFEDRGTEIATPIAVIRDARVGGSWHVLPTIDSDNACITMLFVTDGEIERLERSTNLDRAIRRRRLGTDILGPCAYYAAFGRAGTAIGDWLVRGGSYFAIDPHWTESRDVSAPVREDFPWSRLSIEQTRCANGRTEACTAALMAPNARARSMWRFSVPDRSTGAIRLPGFTPRLPWWEEQSWFARGQGRFLMADLIREHGTERFQTFWQSSQGVGEAFQSAMGEPLDQWMASWSSSNLLYPSSPRAGPAPRGGSTVFGLMLAALMVAWGAMYSRRRQVV